MSKEESPKKVSGWRAKKSESTGLREEESPMDLSSSGGIGFLFHGHFRMSGFKTVIHESDVPHNAEAVCKDGELVGVAEMVVDIELFCIRA